MNLQDVPSLPLADDGPVFAEPWQAQAFAMVVELVQAGPFSWHEWASALGQQLREAEAAGHPDDGSRYYHHWVAALEGLLKSKQIAQSEQLVERKNSWADAYRNTPHGKPVTLSEQEQS
ncbi:MAG: nitrile hydratase accessory protein [Gammaproteobacteria bacterium]|nr:nitrile hydratase accessory protein [Gammaproteobacteria bacterium]